MSNSSEYDRIHSAYKYTKGAVSSDFTNPVQKDPRTEQQRVKKTSTLDLINKKPEREFYVPSTPLVQRPISIPTQTVTPTMTKVPVQQSIPSAPIIQGPSISNIPPPPQQPQPSNMPLNVPHETSIVQTSSLSGGLSPQQIQVTQEIVRQAIQEIGKQSPLLLQALIKDITAKAQKYISPVLKDPQEEQKKIFKTSVSDVVNPVEVLHNKLSGFAEEIRESIKVLGTRFTEQIKIPTTYKYIDIDSTYRNRNLYPNPCSFVVPFTDAAPKDSGLTADDPVFLGYPWVMGMVDNFVATVGASTTTISSFTPSPPTPANYDGNLGNTPAQLINNFYINYYIQIFDNPGAAPGLASQYSRIISNTATTFTLSPQIIDTTTGLPLNGGGQNRRYRIRKDLPILSNLLPAGSTENTIILSSDANPDYAFYDGYLIIFYDPTNYTTITGRSIISSYNGDTKTATLSTALSTAPAAGVPFEIVKFSYDNLTPLRNSGTRTLTQPVCLDILLLHLVVPFSPIGTNTNLYIKTGNGGTLRNYPYLYVHFYNDNSHSKATLYGNNPNAEMVTFKVTLDNPILPGFQPGANDALQGQFVVFNNINVSAPQNIKLSTLESLRFRVTLPNGEDLIYNLSDNYSPLPPNPRVQFSAMIAVNRKF